MSTGSVTIVAVETWRRVVASRASLGFAALFATLALTISYFGLAGQRASGFQGFARVTASLGNLVVIVVPLLALILGTTELTGRRRSLSVLLAQPVRRGEALLGMYLGVATALAAALLIGLGGAGLLIAYETGTAALGAYLTLIGTSLALLLSFLALAFLLGVVLLDRLKSMAAALLVWFATVIAYDLVLIGLTAVLRGLPLKSILIPAILTNPVDIARVLVTLGSGRGALFGPAGASLVDVFGSGGGAALAVTALVVQIVLPLGIAVAVFAKRDL